MIRLEKVCIALSGREVVSDVSFQARAGELTAIIGPNGSGKTTTMRAMSAERLYSGKIYFGDRDIRTMRASELARERAVLAQSTSLGFPFRVREILEMGIIAGDSHSCEEAERVMTKALAAVDLSGFENRIATALSGGEQARMHMARALCQISAPTRHGSARWLFLDEPVASLDVKHQLAIMTLARNFARSGGGVIAVMHDLNLTAMFADHVVMMRAGRVDSAGAPREVFTEASLGDVYGCPLSVKADPDTGLLRILPPYISA